ncbi:5-hydroxytryptamine receptor 1A-alpha [Mizuhopecten yessoensis]|uniref:5-hydroxytryptamine receptor 1A-alpha n=1 Tax=Mizuhopecten yessoensis TaxID=6573 RepID=A0A210R4M3_MIZYE|nr:5-hydroxytryptamine receptor 1A-alpha [Mizuhopecten yessoensis]
MTKYKNTKTSKVSPHEMKNKYGNSANDISYISKNTAESTFTRVPCGKSMSLKQTSLECTAFSDDIHNKGQDDRMKHDGTLLVEKHKQNATSLSSCDLTVSAGNNSNGCVRKNVQSASLPDIASSSSKTIKVVGMDGTERIARTNNEHVVGAVCLMTSRNRSKGRRRLELRTSKKIAILIGTFMGCWLPLPVFVVCNRISGQTSLSDTLVCVLLVLSTVGCSSVALNPIMVAMMNRQLNSALKSLLKFKSKK